MTPDKLPEEMQEQIKQKAEDFANSHVNGRTQRDIWELVFKANRAGATAWALWKVKYDQLSAENSVLRQKNIQIESRLSVCEKEVCDHRKEYQQLQAQSQRLADALDALKEGAPGHTIQFIDKALQQFKDGKGKEVEQKHNVSIGEWITYCKDCGFPVDECNCIDKETLS